MDFGWCNYERVDFTLTDLKQTVLSGKREEKTKVYIGMPSWGKKEWRGKLYPIGTKDSEFLDQYVKHFNSIELNATHYQIYNEPQIAKWAIKAKGLDFKFCPKFPNVISHYSGFNNIAIQTDSFLQGIAEFGENLGPIFLQVSEKYTPNQKEKLYNYLASLPKDLQFFLEVRHEDWFTGKEIKNELLLVLKSLNIGLITTDTPGRRDVLNMELTTPKAMIRFVCDGKQAKDFERILNWRIIIQSWIGQGLKDCYIFLHVHDESNAIVFARHVQKLFADI